MSIWQRVKAYFNSGVERVESLPSEGATPGEKDTLRAIRELSMAVMNHPDMVEIYLALGNLYRARGDVERAVQIRESLLIRPELQLSFKGKTYFELGQDYRRAGLMDRALSAYLEAERLNVPAKLINGELAALYAGTGEWGKACEYFHALGNPVAEAHFMVRLGTEIFLKPERRESKKATRIFERALKVYPSSVEAWSALIAEYILANKWTWAARTLGKALERIPAPKNFMLLEEILRLEPPNKGQNTSAEQLSAFYGNLTEAFIPVLQKRPPELFSNFYGAMFLQRGGFLDEAGQWLDKTLVLRPDFWHGRLLRLAIARQRQDLPPLLDADLDFFIKQSDQIKRFVCSACGLNREQLFYCCQRCNSWHSADYKLIPLD